MTIRFLAALALLLPSAFALAGTPAELPPVAGEVIQDPSMVARCLCLRRELAELNQSRRDDKKQFEDAQARVDQLQAELDRTRPDIDVDDEEQVDAFRRLLKAHDQAAAELFSKVEPDYAEAVKRYNAAVHRYNASCAGHALDPPVVARVQHALVCRARPAVPEIETQTLP